jgi:hypothetical protein
VTVDLVMRVSRGEDDRLSGTVRVRDAADTHDFSGTLELMRVFEELVPLDPEANAAKPASRGGTSPALPGSSEPSNHPWTS